MRSVFKSPEKHSRISVRARSVCAALKGAQKIPTAVRERWCISRQSPWTRNMRIRTFFALPTSRRPFALQNVGEQGDSMSLSHHVNVAIGRKDVLPFYCHYGINDMLGKTS